MKQLDIPKITRQIEFIYDEEAITPKVNNDPVSTICYVQCVKTSTITFITMSLPANLLSIKIDECFYKNYHLQNETD